MKRLTFADEHGDILVVVSPDNIVSSSSEFLKRSFMHQSSCSHLQNVFVDQLHYGHNSNSLPSMGSVSTGKCCSVS